MAKTSYTKALERLRKTKAQHEAKRKAAEAAVKALTQSKSWQKAKAAAGKSPAKTRRPSVKKGTSLYRRVVRLFKGGKPKTETMGRTEHGLGRGRALTQAQIDKLKNKNLRKK